MKMKIKFPEDGIYHRELVTLPLSEYNLEVAKVKANEIAGKLPRTVVLGISGNNVVLDITVYMSHLAYMVDVLKKGLYKNSDNVHQNLLLCGTLN